MKMETPWLLNKTKPEKRKTALGDVEYAEFGDGPAVVALHGAMGGYDQSRILARTVGSPGYRYIAVTRPGYLGTPMSSGQSPEQQGDLVAALLDSLDIRKAGVIAISGGGPAALQFGLRHPERCNGLVLLSTCAEKVEVPVPFSFKIMKFLIRCPWFAERIRAKTAKNLVAAASRSVHDPKILERTINDPEAWPLFSELLLSTCERMGERMDGTENDIHISRTASYPLEDMKPPVLVVHGTRDPLVRFETHVKAYENRLPDVEILKVEKGEHVAIFTHRNMVRKKVAGFMQRHFA